MRKHDRLTKLEESVKLEKMPLKPLSEFWSKPAERDREMEKYYTDIPVSKMATEQ